MASQSDEISDGENGSNSDIDPIEVAIDAGEQATFLNFSGNFLTFEQLQSNFWVYCDTTFPEFTSKIYSCLTASLGASHSGGSLRVGHHAN